MNLTLILCIAAALVGLFLFLKYRTAKEWQISPSEIPTLITKLRSSPGPLAWAQLISDENDGLALDYAVNNGRFEFNWCLLSPKNIEDKGRFIEFLDKHGYAHTEIKAANGCPLIDVQGSDLEDLANRVLSEMYHSTGSLRMLGGGFEWP
jgi:hypothetical protein